MEPLFSNRDATGLPNDQFSIVRNQARRTGSMPPVLCFLPSPRFGNLASIMSELEPFLCPQPRLSGCSQGQVSRHLLGPPVEVHVCGDRMVIAQTHGVDSSGITASRSARDRHEEAADSESCVVRVFQATG